MLKQDKHNLVEKLTSDFKEAKSISLIDFNGLNIVAQQELKKRLKEVKSRMVVAKNTLIKIAFTSAKMPKEITEGDNLIGQTAVVMATDDPVSPIQTIGKFATENESLKFKAGILDGNFQDKDAMLAISKLPSKDVLNGQVVGAIAGPMYGLINNLEGKIQEFMSILDAKIQTQ
jgi:large subunit ribosomal protein L10